MQFRKEFKEKIAAGEVTVSFRKWRRCQVKVGGQYNIHPFGAIEVTHIQEVAAKSLRDKHARAAGHANVKSLLQTTKADVHDHLYEVHFTYLGQAAVNQPVRDRLTKTELSDMVTRLQQMDKRSKRGAWAVATLHLIDQRPGERAPNLAATLGWEVPPFKANVRRLKALGLTISLEVGYKLSARGKQVLKAL